MWGCTWLILRYVPLKICIFQIKDMAYGSGSSCSGSRHESGKWETGNSWGLLDSRNIQYMWGCTWLILRYGPLKILFQSKDASKMHLQFLQKETSIVTPFSYIIKSFLFSASSFKIYYFLNFLKNSLSLHKSEISK